MLSIRNLETSKQAATYFLRDDYYHGSTQHQPSAWWGEGAKMLGLEGSVERDVFEAALDGELPNGISLVGRADGHRRPGFDLTFSAPKSVSLLALIHRAQDVVAAHESAVTEALGFLEREAAVTRATENGITREQATGNLFVARFSHDTSRELDPQLHSHCVVINATRREDGAWRSITNERIYELKMLAGAIYRARLGAELHRLGYDLDRTHADGRFEVRGFSAAQLERFSKRRVAIEEALSERQVEGPVASERAALRTRTAKREVDRAGLLEGWRAEARAIALEFPTPTQREVFAAAREVQAEHALDRAIEHLAERSAVFEEQKLLARALGEAAGRATLSEVAQALAIRLERGDLWEAERREAHPLRAFVTAEALATEHALVGTVELTRGRSDPILSVDRVHEKIARSTLTEGQAAAAELILSTEDGIVGIQGYAGTGKTTALRTVRELAEEAGYEVRGFAPSAAAALLLEEEAGMHSQTLESHLLEEARQSTPAPGRRLWIVDEASMLGNRDAHRLVLAAQRAGARLALVGDQDQLPSIQAGAAFRLLAERGMAIATMDEILRQQNPVLKKAVEAAIRRTGTEVQLLSSKLEAIPNAAHRLDAVARDYLSRSPQLRDRTLVLTASNADRRALNDRIRAGLIAEGAVSRLEQTAPILVAKDFTQAEVRDAVHYRVGDVMRFDRSYRRLAVSKGEYFTIREIDVESNTITLKADDGRVIAWQPYRAPHVEVYMEERRSIAAGDVIRFTRNDRDKHRRNGELARVVAVSDREVVLLARGGEQRTELAKERHWEYACATTVHAAQGRTADAVILHLDTSRSQLTGHESWYVALSRAREDVRVYVDDMSRLPETIRRSLAQDVAIDALQRIQGNELRREPKVQTKHLGLSFEPNL